MRFGSIGIRAASLSKRNKCHAGQAGFTLIEALVALALVVAFAGALGQVMSRSKRLLLQGDGRVRAELFLRSLLEAPIGRDHPEMGLRSGETAGLRWSIDIEPSNLDILAFQVPSADTKGKKQPNWSLLHVAVEVSWGAGNIITGETLRLADID